LDAEGRVSTIHSPPLSVATKKQVLFRRQADSEGGLLLVSLSGYASLYNVNTDLQLFGSALHTAMQDATVGARR